MSKGGARSGAGRPRKRQWSDDLAQQYPREFRIWRGLAQRKRDPYYVNVYIDPTLYNSFDEFFLILGPCKHRDTLDRIDNAKGYEPGNLRWASFTVQARNRTNNKIVLGKPLSEWCEDLGLNYHTVYSRLEKGWTAKRALGLDQV